MALALLSDLGSGVTGEVVHVDAGFHIAGMVFHRPPTAAAGAT
jgi:enoyl-[acyl-carrier protein] reductase I